MPVIHVVKGEVRNAADVLYQSGGRTYRLPELDLTELVWPRTAPPPAWNIPLAEILDFLVATGEALKADTAGHLAFARDRMIEAGSFETGIVRRSYEALHTLFERDRLLSMVEGEIGNPAVLDGWVPFANRIGEHGKIRAFPARLVHILAGNAPGVAAVSITRGALSKGVHLLKMPSNDLFTAPAILQTMASVDADHPVVRSFSAVYWRGGDRDVEGRIFRPTFFDKLVAWGGEAAIRGAREYIGPGLELVAFDPKTSIAMIGKEALQSAEAISETAERAATDSTPYNQAACVSARFHFVEAGDEDAVDSYCAQLQARLGMERRTASVLASPVTSELQDEIEVLRAFDGLYRVWGSYEGRGLVIRSDEPLDIYPDGKIVNVVRVESLEQAVRYAGFATQTVGIYPAERKTGLRDALAAAGVQRVVTLGGAESLATGMSHDGFFPLHRMVRWVNDED
ncbi:long-chain-fatty-acyl-CoA reductase (plasmid) [Novosphingobium pentaromativorans US6-1]|nr:long-chain-fatty-acyl-CoA reductase [Novosphingobium pentaromativorans US6-1]